jgi:membrane protein
VVVLGICGKSNMRRAWQLLRETAEAFIEDDVLSRGAAIAFYSVTALVPVVIIVIWIAGLVFGHAAARDAIAWQFHSLMGEGSAKLLLTMLDTAARQSTSTIAKILGLGTLLIAASGVFGEMQSALNIIWKAVPERGILGRLVRGRAVSLGLVASLGFFLVVSLAVTAALSALASVIDARLPVSWTILYILNGATSFTLLALLFAAIYKVLPDINLRWSDVLVGGGGAALLFELGKFLIGFYLQHSSLAASYGAAGALVVVLFWIFYSAQLFLFGAEFTKTYTKYYGSNRLQS